MSEFPIRLKILRSNRGMTQAELAQRIGVSRSSVSMYESGEREPDFETLEAIADIFNVDMNTLHGKFKPGASDDGLAGARKEFTGKVMKLDEAHFRLVEDIVSRVLAEQEQGL